MPTKTITFLNASIVPAVIYIVWVGTVFWLVSGGRYRAFMQPRFGWLLFVAVAILILYVCAYFFRTPTQGAAHASSGKLARGGLLMLPIFFLYATYGHGLGSHALVRKTAVRKDSMVLPDRASKDSEFKIEPGETISVLTVARHMHELNGQRVITEGMVYREEIMPPGSFLLFRFGIFCCAADAIPIWVIVQGDMEVQLTNESWAKVEGLLTVKPYMQKQYPVINAEKVKKIPSPPPEQQYLFF